MLLTEIKAVVVMNLTSLPQRKWMSLATLIAIAIVIAVLLAFLSMSNGFVATVENSGSDDVAIILRKGAQAELNSVLTREQVSIFENSPGIQKDDEGIIASAELYVIVDGVKKSTNTEVNLPLRGIDRKGLLLRPNIQLLQGRIFELGKNELIVGSGVLEEYSGFELDQKVTLAGDTWTVVGVFDAQGSVFGSELWADVRTVQSQFNREGVLQLLRVKLITSGETEKVQDFADNDPRLNVDVFTEKQYFHEQASGVSDLLFYLGWPLSIAMAMGALAGALNTMYTSVAQRSKEIATLRAIGFSGTSAFWGTLIESLIIALVGGILGAFMAYLFFDGITTSTLGSSFSQVVFDFQVSFVSIKQSIALAIIIGFIGGMFPALKAAKMPINKAFVANI